jgi:uncharacterized protein YndB with AHSA1/START domain
MNLSNYEVVTTRVLNFPRQSVYKAWTDPNHLQNWWGPKGFTNTFHEFDLRAGGKWRFIMHGPDKKDYPNESKFVEIIEPELLVFNHLSNPVFQVRTEFTEVTSVSTKVTFRMIFPTQELFDALKNYVPEKNEENFDRLEVVLQKMNLL